MNNYRKCVVKAIIAIAAVLALSSASFGQASAVEAFILRALTASPADQAALDRSKLEIEKLAKDLGSLELSKASLEAKIEAEIERISRLTERYARAKAEYDEHYSAYEKRLIAIYKARGEGAFPIIISAKTVRDLASGISATTKASLEDARLLSELKKKKREAESSKNSAEEEKASLDEMRRELEKESSELKERLERARETYKGLELLLDEARKEEMKRVKAKASLSSLPIGVRPSLRVVSIGSENRLEFLASSNGPTAFKASGNVLTGIASWYGNEFNGRPTANGEIYNQEDFTAASKELPFGTYLAVSHKGRGVIVRINDRGPFVKGRFLDLSKGAAKALGLGLGEVKAEIVYPTD